jgi:acetylornithine deacetylase/succinyl-diaminopimelate desuccinylase-like protein
MIPEGTRYLSQPVPPPSHRSPPGAAGELRAALRRRSRIALYSSLVASGLFAWSGVRFVDRSSLVDSPRYRWAEEDLSHEPAVELLRRYVQIDTAQPDADELSGARFLAAELRAMGLEPVLEDLGNRKANVWAVFEGETPEAIVLHSHIDTDPLGDPALWQHPPLSADVEGPSIWGRGTFDMKSVAITQLEALRELVNEARRSGKRPARSVIFLATGAEEIGGEKGMRHILADRSEIAARFAVVLTEGGVVETLDFERVKYWGTEIAQRALVNVVYLGERAELEVLRQQLTQPLRRSGPFLTPEVRSFLASYAPTRDRQDLHEALGDPERLLRDPVAIARLPVLLQSLFFHEAFPDRVFVNAEGRDQLTVAITLLPGGDIETVLEDLIPAVTTRHLERHVLPEVSHPVGGSPTDHWAYLAIARVLGTLDPPVVAGPFVLTRSLSDARWVRARGIPAYGFSPFRIVTSESLQVGAPNERIGIVTFLEGVGVYSRVLRQMTTPSGGPVAN